MEPRNGGAAVPEGRRERRKRATREEILAAARRLLGEKGLYESRIEDVTGLAGIAKGTLYTYFADKDEMIRAVVAQGFHDLAAHLALEVRGARSLPAVSERVILAHLEFLARHPDLMRIFHQVRGALKFPRPEWRRLHDVLDRYVSDLALILAGEDVGSRPATKGERSAAELLFGAISGITSLRASLGADFARASSAAKLARALVAVVRDAAPVAPRRSRSHGKGSLTLSRRQRIARPHVRS